MPVDTLNLTKEVRQRTLNAPKSKSQDVEFVGSEDPLAKAKTNILNSSIFPTIISICYLCYHIFVLWLVDVFPLISV